jgi:hypothetical protein
MFKLSFMIPSLPLRVLYLELNQADGEVGQLRLCRPAVR